MSLLNNRSIVNFVAVNGESNVDVVVVSRALNSKTLAKRKPCRKTSGKCAASIARICTTAATGADATGRGYRLGHSMPAHDTSRGQWPVTQTLRRLERNG